MLLKIYDKIKFIFLIRGIKDIPITLKMMLIFINVTEIEVRLVIFSSSAFFSQW